MELTLAPRIPAVWIDRAEVRPILVVDDSAPLRALILETLRDGGYATVAADNGRDALDLVRRTRPALIILDLAMPTLDGWSFLSELRRQSAGAVPVILTSGIPDLQGEAERLRVAAFLPKPFSIRALRQLVRDHSTPV